MNINGSSTSPTPSACLKAAWRAGVSRICQSPLADPRVLRVALFVIALLLSGDAPAFAEKDVSDLTGP